MKKFNLPFTYIFLFCFISICFSQRTFAPKLEVQKFNISDSSLKTLLSKLDNVDIPEEEIVGIPPYPQAKIIEFKDGSKDCFNCIRLITNDECEKIVTF